MCQRIDVRTNNSSFPIVCLVHLHNSSARRQTFLRRRMVTCVRSLHRLRFPDARWTLSSTLFVCGKTAWQSVCWLKSGHLATSLPSDLPLTALAYLDNNTGHHHFETSPSSDRLCSVAQSTTSPVPLGAGPASKILFFRRCSANASFGRYCSRAPFGLPAASPAVNRSPLSLPDMRRRPRRPGFSANWPTFSPARPRTSAHGSASFASCSPRCRR